MGASPGTAFKAQETSVFWREPYPAAEWIHVLVDIVQLVGFQTSYQQVFLSNKILGL